MNKYNKALALPNEVWEDVKGYEGLYKVSSMGRVKSLNYNNTRKERILKPAKSHNGYLIVGLCKDGKRKIFKVHRLVATAFIENPDNKPQINHLDEVKTSNHYSNLCWTTPKENINFGTRTERTSKPVQGIDPKTGKVVVEFPSTKEAERNGYNHGNVAACCRGERKHHHGLIWQYKE